MVFPGTCPNLNPKARVRVRIRIQGLRKIKWVIKLAVKNERKNHRNIQIRLPKIYEKSSQQKSAITNLFFSHFQPNQPIKKVQNGEFENKSKVLSTKLLNHGASAKGRKNQPNIVTIQQVTCVTIDSLGRTGRIFSESFGFLRKSLNNENCLICSSSKIFWYFFE